MKRLLLLAAAALLIGSSCNPENPPPTAPPSPTPSASPTAAPSAGQTPITHIVVVIQENRSVDNLFQQMPGIDVAPSGVNSSGQTVPLQPVPLTGPYDMSHKHAAWLTDYRGGTMNGWDLAVSSCKGGGSCPAPAVRAYGYVPQSEVQPYYTMAETYTFGDEMFQTNEGPSFPAHQYLASGTSAIKDGSNRYASENPNGGGNLGRQSGGCDSAPKVTVPTIDMTTGQEKGSVFPCFDRNSIFSLLDAAGIGWRYYQAQQGAGLWNTPDSLSPLCPTAPCNGNPDFAASVISPPSQFLTDIAGGTLAAVTYITPTAAASDHAGSTDGSGPAWVASIVDAIGESPYWGSTAIFVVWDDWGGWYDHVKPPVRNYYELGFRVPLLVISPYARLGYVSTQQHEFGSILHFTEETFGLPSLGTTDVLSDDLSDCFDFTQTPTPFTPIAGSAPIAKWRAQSAAEPVDDDQ